MKLATKFTALALICVMFIGCFNKATVAALVQTLGTACSTLASVEGNPTLAAQITTDTTAAVTAINNWQNGTPAQLAIEALGILIDDLNLIPYVGPYTALIDLALVTAQTLIEIIASNSPPTMTAHKAKVPHRVATYSGKVPKNAAQFRTAWNGIIFGDSRLSPLTIK